MLIEPPPFQLNLVWNISYYTSPVLLTFLYRRGYFDLKVIASFDKVTVGVGMLIAFAFCLRGLGRERSQVYKRFFGVFQSARANPKNDELRNALMEYDFDFKQWPLDWSIKELKGGGKVEPNVVMNILKEANLGIMQIPYEVLAYLAIHTFGLKMIYPGSLGLLQSQFHPMLVEGRARMIQDHGGVRGKIETLDGNEIDTMFVDNRTREGNGKTLVICSEGNAGFYEIGIASTPLDLGYSILGWNHPGFGGSSVSLRVIYLLVLVH